MCTSEVEITIFKALFHWYFVWISFSENQDFPSVPEFKEPWPSDPKELPILSPLSVQA